MRTPTILSLAAIIIAALAGYYYYAEIYQPRQMRTATMESIIKNYGIVMAREVDQYLRYYESKRPESYLLLWGLCQEIYPDNPADLLALVERRAYDEVRNPQIKFEEVCRIALARQLDETAQRILEAVEKEEREAAIQDSIDAEIARQAPPQYQYHTAQPPIRPGLTPEQRRPTAPGYTYSPEGATAETAIPTTLDQYGRRVQVTAPR